MIDLLTPWIMLAAVLIPLVYVEKWIHSHLYGVGWLLTNDKKSATAIYYVLLFPGVFVHEFVQYLLAGALNVRIKRMIAWPEAQEDGTLRLDFVQIQGARWYQAAIIGAGPMIVGMAIVWLIASEVLRMEAFLTALETTDFSVIGPAFQDLISQPDFYLWLYLVFAISNAMLPTPADREGWPLVIAFLGVALGFLVIFDRGGVLEETFRGPVAHGVERLATALAAVLVVEFIGILFIGFFEEVLERFTKRKFQYTKPPEPRQPGSARPLPPGVPPPSIYHLTLPVPNPVQQMKPASRASRRSATGQPTPPPKPSRRPAPAAERTSRQPPRTPPPKPAPGQSPAPSRRPSATPGFARRPAGTPPPRSRPTGPPDRTQRPEPTSARSQPAPDSPRPVRRPPGPDQSDAPAPSRRPFPSRDEPPASRPARPPERTKRPSALQWGRPRPAPDEDNAPASGGGDWLDRARREARRTASSDQDERVPSGPTAFPRRPDRTGGSPRPSTPAFVDDDEFDDFDEDDYDDDLEYVDFDEV